MKSSLLCPVLLLCLLFSSPAQPASLQIEDLRRVEFPPGVQMRLLVDLDEAAGAALESGIVLPFVIQWRQCQSAICASPEPGWAVRMRYAPLLERYLLEIADRPARSFAFRANLLSALENPPPLPIPAGAGWQLRMSLQVEQLPAPLRLPARWQAQWRLSSGWVALP